LERVSTNYSDGTRAFRVLNSAPSAIFSLASTLSFGLNGGGSKEGVLSMLSRSALTRQVDGSVGTLGDSGRGGRRVWAASGTCQILFAGVVGLLALLGCSEREPSHGRGSHDTASSGVATVRAALTRPGLVAAYSFDEGSGTTAHDLSGN